MQGKEPDRKDHVAHAEWSTAQGRSDQAEGMYSVALDHYLRAMDEYGALRNDSGIAVLNMYIGSIYQYMRDTGKASDHYRRSLAMWQRIGSARDIAILYNNIGSLAAEMAQPDSALAYHWKSMATWKQLGDSAWQAVSYMNMASCLDQMGKSDSAQRCLLKSISMIDPQRARDLYVRFNNMLGLSYAKSNRPAEGLAACRQVQAIAEGIGNRPLELGNCECFFRNYAALGDQRNELRYFKRYIALKDSLYGGGPAEDLARIGLTYAFKQQQLADSLKGSVKFTELQREHMVELLREENRRNILLISAVVLVLTMAGLWSRLRFMRRSSAQVKLQRDRADGLLHNILPASVATEMLATGKAKAQEVANAAVLFTDFQAFTSIVQHLPAAEVVALVDLYFTAFDGIVRAHGLEKIKTIGDAYMVCGGVPEARPDAALAVVMCALALQDFVVRTYAERKQAGLPAFAMRMGVHAGPVVTGVVGAHKFAFDIWGDTVNTAARMENSSEPGRLNISEAVHGAIKDDRNLRFTPRGEISVKGKGAMLMYWVERAAHPVQ
jgi:adenylate cyclase